MNKLVKTIDKNDLILEYINAINGPLKLTEREKSLICVFIKADIDYDKNPVGHKNVANKDVRKWITANLGVTKDNLSRYIKSFRERGMLKIGPAEDELRVNRILVPDLVGDRVQLTIILKLKQDDN